MAQLDGDIAILSHAGIFVRIVASLRKEEIENMLSYSTHLWYNLMYEYTVFNV